MVRFYRLPLVSISTGRIGLELNRCFHRAFQPDLEYMFQTPPDPGGGLQWSAQKRAPGNPMSKLRGFMETVFQDRLSEFHETPGLSLCPGEIDYQGCPLPGKIGGKRAWRDILLKKPINITEKHMTCCPPKKIKSEEDNFILIDILNSWGVCLLLPRRC